MASTNDTVKETFCICSSIPPGIFTIASLPREIMIDIASSLDPRTVLALIHTSPAFSYVMCIFTARYTHEQDVPGHSYTPLQYFVKRGIERVVIHLLEHGADPNVTFFGKPKLQSPPHLVAMELLEHGAHPDHAFFSQPKLEKAPLLLAIQLNSPSMVSLLLRYGARVNDRDNTGRPYREYTPLLRALTWYNSVQQRRSSAPEKFSAIARRSIEIVRILLAAGADVAACTGSGHTPLHIACGTQDVDPALIESLITAGSDISCRTPPQQLYQDSAAQPIHYAAAAGNTAVVQMLLSAGVDVEVETGDRIRALDLAIMGMHVDTVQLLIDVGADTSTRVVVGSEHPERNIPSYLVGDTALWGELDIWFRSRGWNPRGHSLRIWACTMTHEDARRDKKCGFARSW